MSYSIPSGIAIRPDCEHLLLPAGLGGSEIAEVVGNKAEILERLRSEQMNTAGFYKELPSALLCELQAAPWVVLDVETTGLTRYSSPTRISGSTRIGQGTWTTYRAATPGATLNTSPRIRVLTVHTRALGTCAWDLDELQPEDRHQLFSAVLDKKIVIGHNAGFDLSWLFGETSARPRFLMDSMLLVRHIRPGILVRLFGTAAVGDETARKEAIELLERKCGKPSASLEYVAASLRLPPPDKSYQKPANWCVSPLSVQHLDYVAGDVDLPLRVLEFLIPGLDVEAMPAHIKQKYPWYLPFATATVRLAEAHVRGVPFSNLAAEELRSQYLLEIGGSVDDLVHIPEYANLRETLLDPHAGDTKEMKQALALHAQAHGVTLTTTEAGNICTNRDAMKESGASKLPASILLESIKTGKKAIGTIDEYKRASGEDGRLHSLITFTTATGRTSSSEPNLQNVPRDPRFRELIRARPGHLILSADYAAIELRIAAVLAERAIADLRLRLNGDFEGWFLKEVFKGVHASSRLVCPEEPEKWTLEWLNEAIGAVAQTVLLRKDQMMMSIFKRKLDPHLVTAIDMARRAGSIECGDNSVEWLAAQDDQARKALKVQLQKERQGAKPTNFGLLYGMGALGLHGYGISNYGLTWTPDEAAQARRNWFDLYPEFRLWHFWTKYTQSRKLDLGTCLLWNSRAKGLVAPEFPGRIYQPTTLVGRPFAILNDFRQAMNYQDQGSGADILARAIALLPEEVADMLLMPVHDELVLEVPASEIEIVKRTVVETMIQSGNEVLGGQIPVEVESVIGEAWEKG
jgi:DNA polymerase-1